MANTFTYQTGALSMKALRFLKNKLALLQFANTDWAKDFRGSMPIGDTVQIPLPTRFLVTTDNNLGYVPQPILQIKTPVTVDKVTKAHFEWDDLEAALYMQRKDIRESFVEAPMAQIATEMDRAFGEYAGNNANNIVGVLGTDPTDLSTFAAARQRMVELGAPMTSGKRGAAIAPQVNTSAVNAFKGLFEDDDEISRQYREGTLGRLQGFRYFESMGLKKHTAGTWAGAVTIATTVANGASTLALTVTSGDTFKKGDKIGINGYYAVNPGTRAITTRATTKQVTVLEDVTAVGTSATISISPTLYGPGSPYQNISDLPVATTALTLFPGTTSPNGKQGTFNLHIHEDAFAFVPIRLDQPKEGGTVAIAEQARDPETGLTVRFVRVWEPLASRWINRFDVPWGMGRLHSDAGAVVLLSA